MKKKHSHRYAGLLTFALMGAPFFASANVVITEIMYDPSGADTDREWVEVTNTSSSAVDVTGYKFFQGNVNHGLTVLTGSATLAAGASAVVAQDQTKFMTDFPSFSGTLFRASFSLNNTGETIALKDASLATLDSVTYASSMGASSDGNTLQRSGTTFVAAVPTPGTFTGSAAGNQQTNNTTATTTQATTSTQTTTNASSAYSVAQITAQITADTTVVVKAPAAFSGTGFGTKQEPLPRARYLWNFGDGTTAEGQSVLHAYTYPGQYAVVLTVANDFSTVQVSTVVAVLTGSFALYAEDDGSLLIENGLSVPIDLGLWMLSCDESVFVVPEHTTLLAQGGVRFAADVTKLSCGTAATLRYPNGVLAVAARLSPRSSLHGSAVTPEDMRVLHTGTAAAANTGLVSASALPTAKASAHTDLTATAALAAESGTPTTHGWWTWMGSLVGLLVVGVAGVQFVRPGSTVAGEGTKELPDEFDIA